jgi:O-antigen/teichoic acid export membrane protein
MIARALGPDGYGAYSYLIWLSALALVLINGGVSLGGIKFLAEARGTGGHGYIPLIYRKLRNMQFTKAAAIIALSMLLVAAWPGVLLANMDTGLLYVVMSAALFKSYHMYNVSALKGFEDFRSISFIVVVVAPINMMLVAGSYYLNYSLTAYIWIYLIISILYCFVSMIYIKKRIPVESNTEIPADVVSRMNHYVSRTAIIAVLGFIVLKQSEIYFLNQLSTSSNVAYYNTAFALAVAAITLIPGVYSSILLPLMARAQKEQGGEEAGIRLVNSLRYLVQLSVALIFPVAYYAEPIVLTLYGENYHDAVLPFRVILIGFFLKSFIDVSTAHLMSTDKQSTLLWMIASASVVTVILDYYLIKHFELNGALAAFSIETLFTAILFYWVALRAEGISLDWSIYFRTLVSATCAIAIAGVVSHSLGWKIVSVLVGCVLFGLIYVIMLAITKGLSRSDIRTVKYLNERSLRIGLLTRFVCWAEGRMRA